MPPKVNDDRLGIRRWTAARRWLAAHPDVTVRGAWAALSAGVASVIWMLCGTATASAKLWSVVVMACIAVGVSVYSLSRASLLLRQVEEERQYAEDVLATARSEAVAAEHQPHRRRRRANRREGLRRADGIS